MNKKTEWRIDRRKMDRQFATSDAVIERVVTAFIGRIEKMMFQWSEVHRWTIINRLLMRLCDLLSKLIDTFGNHSVAAIKLSNALADYRDSPGEERHDPLCKEGE